MSKAFPTVQKLVTQALLGVAAVFLLASCASKNPSAPSSAGSAAAIMTESDETNARMRAKLRVELAIGYFQAGQTTVALDEIKQALVADPTFPEAYNLRGLIYMRLDDPASAEDSFRRLGFGDVAPFRTRAVATDEADRCRLEATQYRASI